MGELAQSSVVRETAGQEFEPEYARGDHMLYISFVVVFVCMYKSKPSKSTWVCYRKEPEHQ